MSYLCTTCGKTHDELPAIAFARPHYYHILSEEDKNAIAKLIGDFCVIEYETQTDRFIRCVLVIPVIGSNDAFEYGVWVSLSEKSFDYYRDHFREDITGTTFFGFLCSKIPDYKDSTLLLKTDVVCRAEGERPQLLFHEGQAEHALVNDALNGITLQDAYDRIHRLQDNDD